MYKIEIITAESVTIKDTELNKIIILNSVEEVYDIIDNKPRLFESKDFLTAVSYVFDNLNDNTRCTELLYSFHHFKKMASEITEEQLYNFINKYLYLFNDELAYEFGSLVRFLTDTYKLKLYNENSDYLSPEITSEIIKRITDNDIKLELFKNHKDLFNLDQQAYIIRSTNDNKLKLDFFNQNKSLFDKYLQTDLIISIKDDQIKYEILKTNQDLFDAIEKLNIVSTIKNDEIKLEYINDNKDILSVEDKLIIINSLEDKNIQRAINENLSDFTTNVIRSFVDMSEDGNNQNLIINVLDNNHDSLTPEQIIYLMSTLDISPKKQVVYYQEFSNRLSDLEKYILIKTTDNKELKKHLDSLSLSTEIKERCDNLMSSYGAIACSSKAATQFLSQEDLSIFSDNEFAQLFKYCIYTNRMPNISKAIDNPELFCRFKDFRQNTMSQNLLGIINLENTLVEFDKYFDLINECLNNKLTNQEQDILISVLSSKNIDISNKEELQTYATKRKEYIDNLAKEDINSALIYLLTGLSQEEYYENLRLYFNDDQLKISLEDFSEELGEKISLMTIAKDLLNLILKEPLETKMDILQIYNTDLAREFSQGSMLAEFRNNFEDFNQDLRRLYGDELSVSLANVNMPEPKQIHGVNVINLEGSEFKMLIHGLNAYGHGANKYEHRDVGRSYLCTSLISNNHLARAEAKIYYGFSSISNSSLAIEGPSDIYSTAAENSLDVYAYRNPKFLKTEDMIDESIKTGIKLNYKSMYNEIVLFRDQTDQHGDVSPLIPDYVVAFNKPTKHDYKEAKRLGIPLVVINEAIYSAQIEEHRKELESTLNEPSPEINLSPEMNELRTIMLEILTTAKNKCTARQQEAIIVEINTAFKNLQKIDTEEHNV